MKNFLLTLAFWFAVASSALAAVNINTASKDELMSLKGIGEKRADDIIEYRKKNGDFKNVDCSESEQLRIAMRNYFLVASFLIQQSQVSPIALPSAPS